MKDFKTLTIKHPKASGSITFTGERQNYLSISGEVTINKTTFVVYAESWLYHGSDNIGIRINDIYNKETLRCVTGHFKPAVVDILRPMIESVMSDQTFMRTCAELQVIAAIKKAEREIKSAKRIIAAEERFIKLATRNLNSANPDLGAIRRI